MASFFVENSKRLSLAVKYQSRLCISLAYSYLCKDFIKRNNIENI